MSEFLIGLLIGFFIVAPLLIPLVDWLQIRRIGKDNCEIKSFQGRRKAASLKVVKK